MRLVDAHCHLEPQDYPDAAPLLERARAAGVVHAVVVGQLQRSGDFGAALELAAAHPDFLTPTMGIHPLLLVTGECLLNFLNLKLIKINKTNGIFMF